MSSDVASRAVELATGRPVGAVRRLSSGRCSDAWLVEGSARTWVARVPIQDSGRRITYRVESFIGQYLASLGHRVATWMLVDVADRSCSVAPYLPGTLVDYDVGWTSEFSQSLAAVLRDLHTMPARGFGPLADNEIEARGISPSRQKGVVDRWFHATVWPFDGSALATHPIMDEAPELYEQILPLAGEIKAAQRGAIGVVHSDLHQEHLLAKDDGSLAAVLDFGDAFVGAVAWDFALLNWYYEQRNADLVAEHYPDGTAELARGCLLSVAVGLYKAAKNPADKAVETRLRRCIALAQTI